MKTSYVLLLILLCITVACSKQEDGREIEAQSNISTQQKNAETSVELSNAPIRRQALFGDLHVHSSWSLDSYVNFNRVDPDKAYRFARGEKVTIAGDRSVQLDIPLDFAAVTDHAEYLGELSLCLDQQVDQYALPLCQDLRNENQVREVVTRVYKNLIIRDVVSENPQREAELCGKDNSRCQGRARSVWRGLVEVADAHNSPGEFTTLAAYEWTGNPAFKNLHRNIIFRSTDVPTLPTSHFEANTPAKLWRQLDGDCQPPCDAIAIPHNSNQSKGLQFPMDVSMDDAQLRSKLETLVELVQTKGESECKTGVGTADELCNFEKIEQLPVCAGSDGDTNACIKLCKDDKESGACLHKNNYVRNALKDGLRLGDSIGVNPYRFGFIGSTDTHNGTPGATKESNYMGVFGAEDGTPEGRARIPAIKSFKPPRLHSAAGLAGVWAEENTRDSIFAALKRRETFATSGTRIVLRFFAGWDLIEASGKDKDPIEQAYQYGVAMGGELPLHDGEAIPEFLLWAMKAPDGAPLQRIQIIKGWLEDGKTREQTYDAVCSDGLRPDTVTHRCPDNAANVDLATCELGANEGAAELSGSWQDPDFDSSEDAFYYLRVIENPSCRWSTWEALRESWELFPDVEPLIQERAWSSPIWYSAPAS